MINRYTVIGQPIAHSLSPIVHQLFGELTHRKVHYTRTEGTVETFADIVLQWQASGGRGCNVTAPFKEQAFSLCTRLSPGALQAGAVNTIHMLQDGILSGHNTDGPGLVVDIVSNKRKAIAGQRILILGAGGAARGVLGPLLAEQPACLHITNRTASRASELAKMFAGLGVVTAGPLDDLSSHATFDIIINATSLSWGGGAIDLPDTCIDGSGLAYDMAYGAEDSAFMSWARTQGASACNGFGMLVEQAAESFLIWEGVRPKTRMAYPKLQELLAK